MRFNLPISIIDLSDTTAEENWQKIWDAFEKSWSRMCNYHQNEATSISTALRMKRYDVHEALAELRAIAHERTMCGKCT